MIAEKGVVKFQGETYEARNIITNETKGMFCIIKSVEFDEVKSDNSLFHRKFVSSKLEVII